MFKNKILSTKILSFKSWLSILVSLCLVMTVIPFSVFLTKALSNDLIVFTDDFSMATDNTSDPLGKDWQYGSKIISNS